MGVASGGRRAASRSRSTAASAAHPEGSLEQRWLDGDPRAMEQAHRRYRSRLEAVAYRILRDRTEAEDVVQKLFLALRRASYRGKASLWTYLYRAAVNGSVNALRSRRRREAAERQLLERHLMTAPKPSSPGAPGPESKVLEGEILAAVARALLRVKPQHRRVLILRIVHGLSNTEIAEHEQLPLATVGTWLRRGRVELQRGLRPLLREVGRGAR